MDPRDEALLVDQDFSAGILVLYLQGQNGAEGEFSLVSDGNDLYDGVVEDRQPPFAFIQQVGNDSARRFFCGGSPGTTDELKTVSKTIYLRWMPYDQSGQLLVQSITLNF